MGGRVDPAPPAQCRVLRRSKAAEELLPSCTRAFSSEVGGHQPCQGGGGGRVVQWSRGTYRRRRAEHHGGLGTLTRGRDTMHHTSSPAGCSSALQRRQWPGSASSPHHTPHFRPSASQAHNPAVFVDKTTRVICQGITGKNGTFHTDQVRACPAGGCGWGVGWGWRGWGGGC